MLIVNATEVSSTSAAALYTHPKYRRGAKLVNAGAAAVGGGTAYDGGSWWRNGAEPKFSPRRKHFGGGKTLHLYNKKPALRPSSKYDIDEEEEEELEKGDDESTMIDSHQQQHGGRSGKLWAKVVRLLTLKDLPRCSGGSSPGQAFLKSIKVHASAMPDIPIGGVRHKRSSQSSTLNGSVEKLPTIAEEEAENDNAEAHADDEVMI